VVSQLSDKPLRNAAREEVIFNYLTVAFLRMPRNLVHLFTEPKKASRHSNTNRSFQVGHRNPACLGISETLPERLSRPRAPGGFYPRKSPKTRPRAHETEVASLPAPAQQAPLCPGHTLTHTTLLFTEELGPNTLLSKCGESALLVRGDLAGSSKSSKFPVAAAVSRAENE